MGRPVLRTGGRDISRIERRPQRRRGRQAFTLLEVLLAMAVGLLLLGALYAAVGVQLHHAQAGREIVDRSTLARALLTRVAGDITLALAPATTPSSGGSASGGTGASGSGGGGNGGGTTGGAGASSTTASTSSTVTGGGTFAFGAGVQGDSTTLILYTSRLPLGSVLAPTDPAATAPGSDLRRITYWLASGGLARQEIVLVTSDDAQANVPPNVADEAGAVIAEEVKSLTFSYFDGSAWQDSWNGATPGADGVTPIGPPLAVAINMDVALPAADGGQPVVKTYRHVVAIPTAAGTAQQQQTTGP